MYNRTFEFHMRYHVGIIEYHAGDRLSFRRTHMMGDQFEYSPLPTTMRQRSLKSLFFHRVRQRPFRQGTRSSC